MSTKYLSLADVIALHTMIMERMNSSPMPLRDEGALESAVQRPKMVAFYEQADIIRQAVVLAVGISQAQAFLDGKKRTAFAVLDVFLRINGWRFTGDSLALAKQLVATAGVDNLTEAEAHFEQWLWQQVKQH